MWLLTQKNERYSSQLVDHIWQCVLICNAMLSVRSVTPCLLSKCIESILHLNGKWLKTEYLQWHDIRFASAKSALQKWRYVIVEDACIMRVEKQILESWWWSYNTVWRRYSDKEFGCSATVCGAINDDYKPWSETRYSGVSLVSCTNQIDSFCWS